jgi:ATP-dependent Clp protease ATP-binding subunit ClpC
LTNDAKEFLIKKGTNLDFGARPLRRALENFVEDPLSEELLHGNFAGKNRIVIDIARDSDGKMKHLTFEGVLDEPDAKKPLAIGEKGDADH